jgi:hypothetical protein
MGFTFDFFCTNLFIIAPKLVQSENERFTTISHFFLIFNFHQKKCLHGLKKQTKFKSLFKHNLHDIFHRDFEQNYIVMI